MTDPIAGTPTSPGLYLDAVGEVWRVRAPGAPCRSVTFDELLEQAITQPAALAARSGPFTPLLTLTVPKQNLLLEALAELHYSLEAFQQLPDVPRDRYRDQLQRITALSTEIEGLG